MSFCLYSGSNIYPANALAQLNALPSSLKHRISHFTTARCKWAVSTSKVTTIVFLVMRFETVSVD